MSKTTGLKSVHAANFSRRTLCLLHSPHACTHGRKVTKNRSARGFCPYEQSCCSMASIARISQHAQKEINLACEPDFRLRLTKYIHFEGANLQNMIFCTMRFVIETCWQNQNKDGHKHCIVKKTYKGSSTTRLLLLAN